MKVSLEKILRKIELCDLFLIEVKKGWFLELKCPPEIQVIRTVEDLFTPIHEIRADHDVQMCMIHNDSIDGKNFDAS